MSGTMAISSVTSVSKLHAMNFRKDIGQILSGVLNKRWVCLYRKFFVPESSPTSRPPIECALVLVSGPSRL